MIYLLYDIICYIYYIMTLYMIWYIYVNTSIILYDIKCIVGWYDTDIDMQYIMYYGLILYKYWYDMQYIMLYWLIWKNYWYDRFIYNVWLVDKLQLLICYM